MVLLNFYVVVIAFTTISTFGLSNGIRVNESVSFVPRVPERCVRAGICENTPDYPHAHVDALLAKLNDNDKIRFNFVEEYPNTRRGGVAGSPDDMELCKSEKKTIYPDAARTKDGDWVYVINGKRVKQQGFVVEQCVNPGAACDSIASFPSDVTALCKQKFISSLAWTLGADGGMHRTNVQLPSCCSCIVNPTYNK